MTFSAPPPWLNMRRDPSESRQSPPPSLHATRRPARSTLYAAWWNSSYEITSGFALSFVTPDLALAGDISQLIYQFQITLKQGVPVDATIRLSQAGVRDVTEFLVNSVPVAGNDSYAVAEDGTLAVAATLGLLANDTDPDNDPLQVTLASGPAHGTLALLPDGSFTYQPFANYHGADSFTYIVADGLGGTATATASLLVTPVNDAPVGTDDNGLRTPADTALTLSAAQLLANDSDVDGDALSIISVTSGTGGTVAFSGGQVLFTPAANFLGNAGFSYTLGDGHGGTGTAQVAVLVEAPVVINSAPLAGDDSYGVAEDGTLAVTAALGVLANDTDPDNDPLQVSLASGPAHGTLALLPDGSFTYQPFANFSGADSFTYTVSDGQGGTAAATASLTVQPVNDAPVGTDDAGLRTPANTVLALAAAQLLANDSDVDGDALSITAVASGTGGTVALSGGQVLFTPAADFLGNASFSYTLDDGNGGTSTAQVAVLVEAPVVINSAPLAGDDSYGVAEDGTLAVAAALGVLANDTDPDNDPLQVSLASGPAHGTLALLPDGSFTYQPFANFSGADSFTYTVSDGQGGTAAATASLTVQPVNDAPVGTDDAACALREHGPDPGCGATACQRQRH